MDGGLLEVVVGATAVAGVSAQIGPPLLTLAFGTPFARCSSPWRARRICTYARAPLCINRAAAVCALGRSRRYSAHVWRARARISAWRAHTASSAHTISSLASREDAAT